MHIEGKFEVKTQVLTESPYPDVPPGDYEYETAEIYVDGRRVDPEQFTDALHCSDQFQWGYGGSGPAFLAYVLLLLATDGDHYTASNFYQIFKWEVVAQWEFGKPFAVDYDVDSWIALQERKRA